MKPQIFMCAAGNYGIMIVILKDVWQLTENGRVACDVFITFWRSWAKRIKEGEIG